MSASKIRTRLGRGDLVRIHPKVLAVAGSPPSWHQRVLAASLAVGGVASHPTALLVHGLGPSLLACAAVPTPGGRFRRPRPDPFSWPIHMTQFRGRGTARGVIVHRPARLPPQQEVTVVDGVPVVTIERALMDSAATLPAPCLERVLDDCLAQRRCTVSLLRNGLGSRGQGRPVTAALRRLLDERDGARHLPTAFERDLLRVIDAARLRRPVTQHEIRDEGRLIGRVDAAYIGESVWLEADDYATHIGKAALDRDLDRQNALTSRGWLPLRFTPDDLRLRPAEAAAAIARTLATRNLT